ncbi:winged helix-turn-helix domain-containing protein, partial [Streptomyces sp. SID7499]|nr:winged helix-turn-helix domain-containing protein [Streptomyces sp. SID7499]
YGDDQTIDVHLSWLRRKLGETAARPRYLHTLRGVGVKLQPPADAPADTPVTEPPA